MQSILEYNRVILSPSLYAIESLCYLFYNTAAKTNNK
jgi:hypothetical protein